MCLPVSGWGHVESPLISDSVKLFQNFQSQVKQIFKITRLNTINLKFFDFRTISNHQLFSVFVVGFYCADTDEYSFVYTPPDSSNLLPCHFKRLRRYKSLVIYVSRWECWARDILRMFNTVGIALNRNDFIDWNIARSREAVCMKDDDVDSNSETARTVHHYLNHRSSSHWLRALWYGGEKKV